MQHDITGDTCGAGTVSWNAHRPPGRGLVQTRALFILFFCVGLGMHSDSPFDAHVPARGESGSENELSVCENPLWGGGAAFRPRSQKAAKVPSLPPLLCREAGDTNQHCNCPRPGWSPLVEEYK